MDAPSISPLTSVTMFSGSILAWPQSHNPSLMTNGHHSPPALVESFISQQTATSVGNLALDRISISATMESNRASELWKLFDVFDCLFHCYCPNFYDYVQNHPDNAGNYGSLSGL
ncbi:hypothetical protein O181_113757 [Austropuccinia psidii MF-1]|uniref:Uncharacterized protein n=1 Tax=Austropuccinia psidii MF-1 TaxID=1389203 RepID=A0A9Q3PVP3_9BASI|nr:hypothetical protein [Austropuccinia psidii MF-1]